MKTGHVFIIHRWRERRGDATSERSIDLDVLDFLRSKGPARKSFLALIGALAAPADGADRLMAPAKRLSAKPAPG
jgi:hypothetical protein